MERASSPRTRGARSDDLLVLQRIEVAAGQRFAAVGMHDVADDEPLPLPVLASYQAGGRAWVSVDGEDRPVGYALAMVVDGAGHLEQLSVHPDAGRDGRGGQLIDVVVAWARRLTLPSVTLSTFADVPWNAPYYERRGFRRLGEDELTPGLLALREIERSHGLDVGRRTFMRRAV